MTFKSWLKTSEYRNVTTPIGDLARDILADKQFPLCVEKYIMREYLPMDDTIQELFDKLYLGYIRYISRDYFDE